MVKEKGMCVFKYVCLFVVFMAHNTQGVTSQLLQKKSITKYSKLKALPKPKHIKRILAFGDSLTEGYFADGRKFYPFTTQLETRLNEKFNYTRFEVLNEGITHHCAFKKLVKDVPEILVRERNRIDLVIVLGGTADFRKPRCSDAETVLENMLQIHDMVHEQGLKSVVVTIPECFELDKQCEEDRLKANKKLKKYVDDNKESTLLCDLSTDLPMTSLFDFDRKVFWDDSVHPSVIGYDKIAYLLYHVIKKEFDDEQVEKHKSIFELKELNRMKKNTTKQRKHGKHD